MKIVGGWTASEFSQKDDWKQLIRSLNLTRIQEDTAIAILDRFKARGVQYGDQNLSFDERSRQKWTSTFLSAKEMRKLNRALENSKVCGRRNFWYVLELLERNGWVKETRTPIAGHMNKGWAFDSAVYRWLVNAERRVPRLWEEAERGWRSRLERAQRGAASKRRGD